MTRILLATLLMFCAGCTTSPSINAVTMTTQIRTHAAKVGNMFYRQGHWYRIVRVSNERHEHVISRYRSGPGEYTDVQIEKLP